jgi:hypothetical protein
MDKFSGAKPKGEDIIILRTTLFCAEIETKQAEL